MKSICTKCHSNIELNFPDIPIEGSLEKCPDCGTTLLIQRVSFAKRALHSGSQITCAECGSALGTAIYCQSCYALYPDYYVSEPSSAAKQQMGKLLRRFSFMNRQSTTTVSDSSYSGQRSTQGSSPVRKGINLQARLALIIVVVILLAGGGGFYWYQERIANQYTESYIRALRLIKSSRDFDVKLGARIATEWKPGIQPILTSTEKTASSRGKEDIETAFKQFAKIPEKFIPSHDALLKLKISYAKLHDEALSPAGGADIYSSSVKKSDDEFYLVAKELKSTLPEKLSVKLAEGIKKYPALNDF